MVVTDAELVDARRRGSPRRPDDRVRQRLLRHPARRPHPLSRRARAARPIGSIVAVNDDASVRGAEGRRIGRSCRRPRAPSWWPRSAASTTSCCFREPTVERLLRLDPARRALQGHRLHRRHRARTRGRARVRRPHRHRRRSEGSLDARPARRAGSPASADAAARARDRADDALLVVRLGSLGDLVHTLPAVARDPPGASRRSRSTGWWTPPIASSSRSSRSSIGIVVAARSHGARLARGARASCGRGSYDVALDFQGLLKSAALARLSGAQARDRLRSRARCASARRRRSTPSASTSARAGTSSRRTCALAARSARRRDPLEFPIADVESAALDAVARAAASTRSRCSTAARPGRTSAGRRIGSAALARVARERHGLTSVVLWGPGERGLADAVVAASDGAAVSRRRRDCRISWRSRARRALMVSGDTGPTAHRRRGRHAGRWRCSARPIRCATARGMRDDISISRYDACDCHYERRCRRDAGRWCLGTIAVDEVCGGRRHAARPERDVADADAVVVSSGAPARAARVRVRRRRVLARAADADVACSSGWPSRWPARCSRLGRRAHREGPRDHAERPVPVRPPSALSRLGADRRRLRDRRAQRAGRRARRSSISAITLVAAMRTEEATLDAKFAGEYAAYREGRADAAIARSAGIARSANREYRAVAGFAAAFLLLAWRAFG